MSSLHWFSSLPHEYILWVPPFPFFWKPFSKRASYTLLFVKVISPKIGGRTMFKKLQYFNFWSQFFAGHGASCKHSPAVSAKMKIVYGNDHFFIQICYQGPNRRKKKHRIPGEHLAISRKQTEARLIKEGKNIYSGCASSIWQRANYLFTLLSNNDNIWQSKRQYWFYIAFGCVPDKYMAKVRMNAVFGMSVAFFHWAFLIFTCFHGQNSPPISNIIA